MKGKKLLKEIQLANQLSYGPEGASLELEPLNVLIGPNASGKSNFIAALELLAATPKDLSRFLRENGGVQGWSWSGGEEDQVARLEAVTFRDLRYHLEFYLDAIAEEYLKAKSGEFLYDGTKKVLLQGGGEINKRKERPIGPGDIDSGQSILSQFKEPKLYPELTLLARQFKSFFFRNGDFSRNSAARKPQPADLPSDFLLDDASNLGLVLSNLINNYSGIKVSLIEKLQLLYSRVEDLTVHVQGNTTQVFFHEKGLRRPISANRISDGTLLFLCLLVTLLHPSPPPLICIEEPEVGLHPDAIHALAELLVDATSRTQLVVTTHSDILVSALSEVPESIVVCEKGEGGTTLQRLEPDKMSAWLEEYRLGDLWTMGQIGGNRW
jgi:predicted ATPase